MRRRSPSRRPKTEDAHELHVHQGQARSEVPARGYRPVSEALAPPEGEAVLTPLLEAANLSKIYGHVEAIRALSFTLLPERSMPSLATMVPANLPSYGSSRGR